MYLLMVLRNTCERINQPLKTVSHRLRTAALEGTKYARYLWEFSSVGKHRKKRVNERIGRGRR